MNELHNDRNESCYFEHWIKHSQSKANGKTVFLFKIVTFCSQKACNSTEPH